MIDYPTIDPEIIRIGPVALRWYGLMYLAGFGASYALSRHQIRKRAAVGARGPAFPHEFIENIYTWLIIGLVLGARLGYVIFYDPAAYLSNPAGILAVWKGGMSFHGGLIGSISAGVWYSVRSGVDPWRTSDLIIPSAPIGLGLGRLGNFINAELYGRITDAPWGMIFPDAGSLPRHPSQLYEFFLEGVVLFLILWTAKDGIEKKGLLTALFLILYGVFRFTVEFFREPDPQLGFLIGFATMGQILSSVMIGLGMAVFLNRMRKKEAE